MSEYEFWQAVYVVAVRSGYRASARSIANQAVVDVRAEFSAEWGQRATPKTESLLSERDAR